MVKNLFGIFVIVHGLIHLLYFGLSRKFLELDEPLAGWPERSWLLSRFVATSTTRNLASVLYVVAIVLFVSSGAGILLRTGWWRTMLIGAAVFSSVLVFLFWDGKTHRLQDKGFFGVLINIAMLIAIFLLDWTAEAR